MMLPMAAMAVVHEHMHQWASQKDQQRQRPHDMRQVLGEQKVGSYRTEYDQADGVSRSPKTGRLRIMRMMDVVHRILLVLGYGCGYGATVIPLGLRPTTSVFTALPVWMSMTVTELA